MEEKLNKLADAIALSVRESLHLRDLIRGAQPHGWRDTLRELREAALDVFGNPEDCDDCAEWPEDADGCRIHSNTACSTRLYKAVLAAEDILGPCSCGHVRAEHDADDERRCLACECRQFTLPDPPAVRPEEE